MRRRVCVVALFYLTLPSVPVKPGTRPRNHRILHNTMVRQSPPVAGSACFRAKVPSGIPNLLVANNVFFCDGAAATLMDGTTAGEASNTFSSNAFIGSNEMPASGLLTMAAGTTNTFLLNSGNVGDHNSAWPRAGVVGNGILGRANPAHGES